MSDIIIKESNPDKNSWFNAKRIKINGLNENFSQKTIDLTNASKKLIEDNSKRFNTKDFIFEKSKQIKEISKIKEITSSSDDRKIKEFFGGMKWADDKFRVISPTFHFNPYNHIKKIEEIAGFFNYYYTFSGNILLTPNIRIEKSNLSDDEKNTLTKIKVIDIKNYIKFVDEVYDFLNKKNRKHIFVPISLRFSTDDLDTLLDHYLKRDYFYYWFDFEGKPIDQTRMARVIHINRYLDNKTRLDDVVTYFTNVKREIQSHVKDEKNPASDVLGTLFGADIIGVNREAPRMFRGKPVPPIAYENKARIFDDGTYYYNKTNKEGFITKKGNTTNNSLILDNEFTKQRKHFLDNSKIQDYLKTKQMLTSFSNGKILSTMQRILMSSGKQRRLF
jgi:hypothetical protein